MLQEVYLDIYARFCEGYAIHGILIALNFVNHQGGLGSRIWSAILKIGGVKFEHQWSSEEYLRWLEQNGWHVTFSKEMTARIALMYTECKRKNS